MPQTPRSKLYISNNTQNRLLHFQQNNSVDDDLHHKCNRLRTTDTAHHHHKITASAPLRQAAKARDHTAAAQADHNQCQDHPHLQLLHLAQTLHSGHYSRLLIKMVTQNTPLLDLAAVLTSGSGSGHLTEKELRAALVNGDWSSFDPYTVKMMIRMFDTDRSGTIGFEEFCGLWGFLAAWRSLFDRFDADRSGNISLDEYTNALVAFGYRLSPHFVDTLFRTYDKRGEGAISFDLFVQSCISLKRMTDVFKKYDDDRDGYITLSL